MAEIHIGTSGWNYDHWSGPFYPEELPKDKWLEHYQGQFETVEVNNTFYNLPNPETVENWKNTVPDHFKFSAKASRYITHMKKLKEPQESLDNMLNVFEAFGEKLGPVLFQLPPNWNFNEERLRNFTELLPDDVKTVFEFRDESWINDATFNILREKNAAFCIYDLAGYQSPMEVTADFVYVRLHGPSDFKYQGKYNYDQLAWWTDRLHEWRYEDKDVYLYFDNDEQGFAPQNALELKDMVG
ncbi:DUF72 domain-containing protein [Rhodohalobacter sp. 614A]|uniref:DUF72 domain-containing protein n=1 Tax=Rhodohalobacter sp. 614A TaxID=2908649 RepID=UPI001F184B70|nr:DUF72 domain-containing protein [Rhodohalobacter sp. 614A]